MRSPLKAYLVEVPEVRNRERIERIGESVYTEKERKMYGELRSLLNNLVKAEYGGVLCYEAEDGSQLSGLTDDELSVMIAQGVRVVDPYDYWHNTGESPKRRRAQQRYHDKHVARLKK
jgi:hypothetical protein